MRLANASERKHKMVSNAEIYHLEYTICEIYEQKIQVTDQRISVPANKKPPVFVVCPKGQDKSELIAALEQLEGQLPSLPTVNNAPRIDESCSCTIYEISEQEIDIGDQEWPCPAVGKKPVIVMSLKGLAKEQLSEALARLKVELSSPESG